MKKTISIIATLFVVTFSNAQNIIVQQNNNTTKQEPQVVYKEKVVYVEKQQQGPILVGGYLYVYPEKLGYYDKCPFAVINGINKKRAYGKSTWRLPTKEEADLLSSCTQIDLKNYGYNRTFYGQSAITIYSMWTEETRNEDNTYDLNSSVHKMAYLVLVCDD